PRGLAIGIERPGVLRAGENRLHCLRAGTIVRERSFLYDTWFREWYMEASDQLVPSVRDEALTPYPGLILGSIWLTLLNRAAELGHGACFVIVPDNSPQVFGSAFTTTCELGTTIASLLATLPDNPNRAWWRDELSAEQFRSRLVLRERLLL